MQFEFFGHGRDLCQCCYCTSIRRYNLKMGQQLKRRVGNKDLIIFFILVSCMDFLTFEAK